MGRGLYFLITAVAAYALYSLFADNRKDPPPSRPRSPSFEIPRRPRLPSPHIPSPRRDDQQHRQYFEIPRRPRSPSPHILSSPRLPSPHIPSPRRDDQQHRQYVDSTKVDHPLVETHLSLRDKAKQEGELSAQCRRKSKEAHERHEHSLAKRLSDQGKRHALKMDTLNAQASAMVFKENNQDKPTGKVDLHGLYVKEAISYSKMALKEARLRGDSEMRLIVGRGKHSDGGISRLKPVILKTMRVLKVHVHVDPKNPGVLRCDLRYKIC